jgi:hypothetical protein
MFKNLPIMIYLSIYQVSTNPKTLINNCTASLEVPLLKVMNGDRTLKREREREREKEILDVRI